MACVACFCNIVRQWSTGVVHVGNSNMLFLLTLNLTSGVDLDECESDPCENGGECHNGNNTYTCSCMPGYNGTNCETGKQLHNEIFCNSTFNIAYQYTPIHTHTHPYIPIHTHTHP